MIGWGVMGGVGLCWQPPKLHLHEPQPLDGDDGDGGDGHPLHGDGDDGQPFHGDGDGDGGHNEILHEPT